MQPYPLQLGVGQPHSPEGDGVARSLARKTSKLRPHENKRLFGKNIPNLLSAAAFCAEEGHWEGDTVVGKRNSKEAVILSLLEKKTENYHAYHIRIKTSQAVMEAMRAIRADFGDNFTKVFKTSTVDNGSEFSDLAKVEEWGTEVFFAHPYLMGETTE